MNAHALRVIEFPAALELVAGKASSALGAERVRESSPQTAQTWLDREHARVTVVRSLIESELHWHPQAVPDIRTALDRLRVEGASLAAADLLAISGVLRSSRLTRDALKSEQVPPLSRALLAPELESLLAAPADEKKIATAIDDDANVRDEASPQLRRIRRELRGSQGELIKLLERLITRLEPHHQVHDMSVTVRNGRFVIPVRREARTTVGGIVHDTSSTGGTLFVEPPAAVEAGNRIRELRSELRGSQGELIKLLERLITRLEPHHQVHDMSVTVRNGRFVIPVRREARTTVGGIVHDTSSTGGTLFVEPPAAVEAGNRIRELEVEEIREIDRILAELTEVLRPSRDAIAATLEALIELDSLYARARFGIEFGCGALELGPA